MRAFSDYIRRIPVPPISPTTQGLVAGIAECLIVLNGGSKNSSNQAAYLERLLNGMVYEIFFEPELHALNIEFFKHLQAANPPDLNAIPETQQLAAIHEFHAKISDTNHPIYASMFYLNGVEIVRTIEGRDEEGLDEDQL